MRIRVCDPSFQTRDFFSLTCPLSFRLPATRPHMHAHACARADKFPEDRETSVVVITTYSMVSYNGKRSRRAQEVMQRITSLVSSNQGTELCHIVFASSDASFVLMLMLFAAVGSFLTRFLTLCALAALRVHADA
jgi:hypothetical protein